MGCEPAGIHIELAGRGMGSASQRAVWQWLSQLYLLIFSDSVIPLLGIHPTKMFPHVFKAKDTSILLVASFVSVKFRKQAKFPSIGNWLSRLYTIQSLKIMKYTKWI